jgi:uncharacterized SAM-binding protein YcdF (DUF218 family)
VSGKRGTGTGIASRLRWLFACSLRGLAAFLALYSLLSLAAAFVGQAYNQNAWWIDLSFLPAALSALEQLALTVALGVFAVRMPRHLAARIVLSTPVAVCLVAAISNTVDVYTLAAGGEIILGFPVPFSLFVCLGMLALMAAMLLGVTLVSVSEQRGRAKTLVALLAFFCAAGLLFPLGQMYCFGTTNYRMPVDAAVVLGARVHADGTPSPVLQDRLDTAIRFYEEGYTPILVMSGGIDADGTSEALAMREYAVAHGVALQDMIIDEYGSNTQQTARNTVDTLRAAGMKKVAAVSNFYHLARIKMLYLAEGMDVVTVPSEAVKDPSFPLGNILREIPGWWYYWFLNLVE